MSIFKIIEERVEEFAAHIEALIKKHFPHATDEQILAVKADIAAPVEPKNEAEAVAPSAAPSESAASENEAEKAPADNAEGGAAA